MMLLRFLRLVPAESHSVFALTLTVGALCGGVAVRFHLGHRRRKPLHDSFLKHSETCIRRAYLLGLNLSSLD
jgi:hypothetical protein